MKYHYSPRKHAWTRCVAQTTERCYYRSDAHGDRTSIAVEHGGGEVTYHQVVRDRQGRIQGERQKTFWVSPVIEGIYGVIGENGSARTYRADNGQLIDHGTRAAYLREVILPRIRARNLTAISGEPYRPPAASGGAAEESAGEEQGWSPVAMAEPRVAELPAGLPSSRPSPIEVPASILTEPSLMEGEAGVKATAEAEKRLRELEWAGRKPTAAQEAGRRARKRKGLVDRLRGLFRKSAGAQAGQAAAHVMEEREAVGRALRSTWLDWFYDAFGVR